jgi:uncharacterized membrane protein YcaP (DUF421 family)
MRRLGLRRTALEHAVRIQNGDSTDDRQRGLLEPTGQLILRLTYDAEPATRGDLASVLARLDSIDRQLTATIRARTIFPPDARGRGCCSHPCGLRCLCTQP